MRRALALLPLALVLCGCGGDKPKFVPVAGRVIVDGKPVANLMVTFQPVGAKEGHDPGPGSAGVTDANGRYTLKVSSQQFSGDGAVVGKHKVRIGTVLPGEGKPTDPEVGSPDGEPLAGKELIPPRYNQDTTLSFDVPEAGTDKADFELFVRTKPK
jgi:hypothetical protein